LDNISVHENLIKELKEPLAGTRSRLSLENQVDAVVRARASRLRNYPAFLAVNIFFFLFFDISTMFHQDFKVNLKALLQGRVLNNEEMADMLSLKDGSADYGTALELLKNDKVLSNCHIRVLCTNKLVAHPSGTTSVITPIGMAPNIHTR